MKNTDRSFGKPESGAKERRERPLRWRGSGSASRRAAAPAIGPGGEGFDADEAIARLLAQRRGGLDSDERGV